jgi:hypothetical protein
MWKELVLVLRRRLTIMGRVASACSSKDVPTANSISTRVLRVSALTVTLAVQSVAIHWVNARCA